MFQNRSNDITDFHINPLALIISAFVWFFPISLLAMDTQDPNRPQITAHSTPSQESGKALFENGRAYFGKGDYPLAAHSFAQLIDRYPGAEGYLDAHLLLAHSFLRQNLPQKALKPIQYFVEASKSTRDHFMAKTLLGRVFLQNDKPNEALLIAVEILEPKNPKDTLRIMDDIKLEALLIKAKAQIRLDQLERAQRTTDSFWTQIATKPNFSEIRTQAYPITMKLKSHFCEKFPKPGFLNENETIIQFQKRSQCVLDTFNTLEESLKEKVLPELPELLQIGLHALRSFYLRIQDPPTPGTPIQSPSQGTTLAEYKKELTSKLNLDLKATIEQVVRNVTLWESRSSSEKVKFLKEFRESISKGNYETTH